MLESTENVHPDACQKATELLFAAQREPQCVKAGNGVHNVNHAIELLDSVATRCQPAVSILAEGAGQESDE